MVTLEAEEAQVVPALVPFASQHEGRHPGHVALEGDQNQAAGLRLS